MVTRPKSFGVYQILAIVLLSVDWCRSPVRRA
jgi:hypothetical protein